MFKGYLLRSASWIGLTAVAGAAFAIMPVPVHCEPLTPAAADPESFRTEEYGGQYGLGLINAADAYARGYTGRGVTVGVVDSGIDPLHLEFDGAIDFGQSHDFVDDTDTLTDPAGHGTHVSGIIAGRKDDEIMHGVAFNASLAVARILDEYGLVSVEETAYKAIDFLSERGVRIINNSWGNDLSTIDISAEEISQEIPTMLASVRRAVERGSLLIWATGNDGMDEASLNSGLPYHFSELRDGWITVTSVDSNGLKPDYANACGVAADWCLAAPGGGDDEEDGIMSSYPDGYHFQMSGTSMAAPHVSGTAALVLEAFPYLRARELQQVLLTTANDIGEAGVDAVYGHGLVNAGKAVRGPGSFDNADFSVDTAGINSEWSNTIGGRYGLVKAGKGELVLSGTNTYLGSTTVLGGTISIASDKNLGNNAGDVVGQLILDGGTLRTIADLTIGRTIRLGAGNGTIQVDAHTARAGSMIDGPGGLIKTGGGILQLSGTNSYSGGTVIRAGTLAVGSDAALGAAAGTVTLDGGTLRTTADLTSARDFILGGSGGTIDTFGHDAALAGSFTGPGGLTKAGAGMLTLSGTLDYAGRTYVNAGTLRLTGAASRHPATVTVAPEASFASTGSLVGGGTVQLDTPTFKVGSDNTDTSFRGRLTGGGALVKIGRGTLELEGINDQTGGTIVNEGTVVVRSDANLGRSGSALTLGGGTLKTADSVTIARPVVVSGTGGTIDTAGRDSTLSGTVSGDGGLTKTGIGTLNITGINSFTGTTAVDQGTLRLNGSVAGPVNIGSDGELRGTGRIAGPTKVEGRLSPGNSPGTLTFTSSVTQAAGSTLSIDIDGTGTGSGAGNYSRVIVTGPGNTYTAGGTLQPVLRSITGSATNSYTPPVGQGFRIVEAEGGVGGAFARIDQPSSGLLPGSRFDAVYGNNNIDLFAMPVSYANLGSLGVSQTANQTNVGSALDAIRPAAGARAADDTKTVFDSLYSLSAGAVPAAQDRIGGQIHADATAASLSNRRLFGRALDARLMQVRGGAPVAEQASAALTRVLFAYAGSVEAEVGPDLGAAAVDEEVGDGPVDAERPFAVWGRAIGQFGKTRSDGNAAGFDQDAGGVLVGGDFRVMPDLVAGLAIGFARGKAKADDDAAIAAVDSYQVAAYAGYVLGEFFVGGNLGFSLDRYDSSRGIAFGSLTRVAEGETGGHSVSAAFDVGYRVQLGDAMIEPVAGLRYDRIVRDGFTESGAGSLNLTVAGETVDSLRSSLGARLAATVRADDGFVLQPELRARWERDLLSETPRSRASVGGAAFVVNGVRTGRDAAVLGAGLAAVQDGALRLFVDYDASLRRRQTEHTISAGLRLVW